MNHQFITHDNNRRLILLFAGWGMDATPFGVLAVPGYDLTVVWDYRSEEFDLDILGGYEEIVVVAWSFGVAAASRFLSASADLPVTSSIAINGTCHPVDDQLGIPEAIFNGTLDGLNERNLLKFYHRMAGSRARFEQFMLTPPQRDIEGLKDELRAIASKEPAIVKWDVAVVSENDRIIPAANQHRAWADEACRVISVDGDHLPDFQTMLTSLLTDKQLVASRFRRAMESYDDNADVQHSISRHLVELWNPEPGSAPDVIEIGCGTCRSTRCYHSIVRPRSLRLWDFNISDPLPQAIAKECDAESEIIKTDTESADVIFSASTIQWFNSLPSFFRNAARVLRKGGLLVVSTFGPDNFSELHQAGGATPRYPSLDEVFAMLPPSLAVVKTEQTRITLDFDTAADVLRHIRLTGVNAVSRDFSTASTRSLMRDYPTTPDGRVTLTYHPIYLILRKL